MARNRIARGWYIVLLVAICAGIVPLRAPVYAYAPFSPITPTPAVNPVPAGQEAVANAPATVSKFSGQKFIVDNSSPDAEQIRAAGGVEVENYGAFSLWALAADAPQLNAISKLKGVTARDDFDTIYLRDNRINTATDKASNIAANLKANLRQNKSDAAQLWLVQFAGPMREAWLKALEADGIKTVIYMPSNAYVIWATGAQLAGLEKMEQTGANRVQWTGAYHPQYRIDPALVSAKGVPQKSANATVPVTVQFYNHAGVSDSLKRLQALGGRVIMSEENILDFKNLTLEIPFSQVENIATWADVFNIEFWVEPKKNDEVQNQIIAGNVISTGGKVVPTAPGYLAWLGTKGFVNDPTRYPIVDVVDDGVDNGTTTPLHPDFYLSGLITNPSRLVSVDNCTSAPSGNGTDGHGNINVGIVGSYNARVGSPHVDAQGYNRGLGVNPFGRLASTKIFGPNFNLTNCGGNNENYAGIAAKSYAKGAKISTNSWGAPTGGTYPTSSQAYDALQRDAVSNVPGNQELLHVFSAGNNGPGASTLGSPGTAKNVISVSATENVRDEGIPDGCLSTASDNADDMSDFSSRGPTTDGRIKPDISAPGVHIQGPASQDPAYNGTGVCGGATNFDLPATKDPNHKYYPNPSQNAISQTLYTWSSGTSHSTPAVAGGLSLIYEYYTRTMRPGFHPSPAMAKALIVNTPRYLNGLATGGNLPSNSQGWGDLNLGAIFDGTPRYLLDQTSVFTATGQQFSYIGNVVSNTKPVHITLVWQDAPGSTTGNSYVNDLNLEVTIGGATYKGNVFNKQFSVTGGAADVRNNTENVFIPAGVSGPMSVRVVAANIAGNGLPNNVTPLDQDFALIIYNFNSQPGNAVLSQRITSIVGGDNDPYAESGEAFTLEAEVSNFGDVPANNLVTTLTSPTPGVTIVDGTSNFGNISPNVTVTNTADRYSIQLSPSLGCIGVITLVHSVNYIGGTPQSITVTLPVGAPNPPSLIGTFTSTDTPLAIPDEGGAPPITSTINATGTGTVSKVTVRVNISHSYVSDVLIFLIAPNGTRVTLSSSNGSSGDNYTGTIFDDDAATPISAGSPPFTGSFRPQQALATVAGAPKAGAWKLEVDDSITQDAGTLTSWTLNFLEPNPRTCANNSLTSAGYNLVATSDGDNVIESSETVSMAFGVKNVGANTVNAVVGTLTTTTPGVTILNGTVNLGNIPVNGVVTNTATPYRFAVGAGFACGNSITFIHSVTFTGGATYTETIVVSTGALQEILPLINRVSVDVPKTIITSTANTVTSTLTVNDTGRVGKLKVRITNFTHTYVQDMSISLQAPDGTTVNLISNRGSNGDNFSNLVFSDDAATSIISGTAPFTGEFRPEQPLSTLRGKNRTGTWRLIAVDAANGDGGTLSDWSLDFGNDGYVCVLGPNTPLSMEIVSGNNQTAPASTTFTNPLVIRVKNGSNNLAAGAPVVYNAPTTGASGTFVGSNQPNLLGVSDANGLVTSTLFSANAITGTYSVTVSVPGPAVASFTLTNTNALPCTTQVVSVSNDNGTGSVCGTLSYALVNAAPSSTITVTTAVNLSGLLTPTVPTGVKIVGGTGDCSSARVIIDGSGLPGDGLRLSGGNELTNLHVKGFAGRQIITLGTGNKLNCTRVSRT
jgi:subtilisin-like proprotein convertase family protein